MITCFLYDLLPVWLLKLGRIAQESALYRLLARIWRFFRKLIRESFCARLWEGSDRLRTAVHESLFCFWADALIRRITLLAGTCFGWLVHPICASRVNTALSRLPRYNLGWLCGIAFLLIYICPDPAWRNLYSMALSILLFVAMLLDAYVRKQPALRIRDLGLWPLCFAFSVVLAVINAVFPIESLRISSFYIFSFLLCASVIGIVTNRGRLMSILGFVYLALLLTALYAIFQRIQGLEPSSSQTDLVLNAGMPGRVHSTMSNPNLYAQFIVLTFPVSLVFCANIVDRRWKTLCVASMAIPVIALLMTYSRSCWVSFALAAVVFLGLWNKRLLPLLLLAAFLAVPLLPESIFNRILTIGSFTDSSNLYRIYIWTGVLRMLRDYGLTGIGLGANIFTSVYAGYCLPQATVAVHSHMLYLEIWAEMGLLGIISYLGMYLSVIRRCTRAMKHADPLLRYVLIACVSSLIGITFTSLAEHILFDPRAMYAFFFLIGISLAAVKLTEESK